MWHRHTHRAHIQYVASHTDTHFDGWEAFVMAPLRFERSLYLPLWWPRPCCELGNRRRGVT